jgi:hypothetical protein
MAGSGVWSETKAREWEEAAAKRVWTEAGCGRKREQSSRAPERQWCAGNVKNSSCWGLVREFRKWQTEVLGKGTNKNETNGPVRTAL